MHTRINEGLIRFLNFQFFNFNNADFNNFPEFGGCPRCFKIEDREFRIFKIQILHFYIFHNNSMIRRKTFREIFSLD